MSIGIYQIRNVGNNTVYIGSSKNIYSRWQRHKHDLIHNLHHNIYLQRAWVKYGESTFVFEILEICTKEVLFDREQHYIDITSNMYNIGSVSGGDNLTNHPHRDLIIKKMKDTLNKTTQALTKEERIERWARPGKYNPNWKGGISSEFYCVDCGVSVSRYKQRCVTCKSKGKNNAFYGKYHTESAKQKIREARIGKYNGNQRKRVSIDGVIYVSCTAAASALGVSPATITYRMKNSWKGYKYMDIKQ